MQKKKNFQYKSKSKWNFFQNDIQNQDAKNCCSYSLRFEFLMINFSDCNQNAHENNSKYKPKSKKKNLNRVKCP